MVELSVDDTSWVCSGCRSVNEWQVGHCYACRTPRAIGLDHATASVRRLARSVRDDRATPYERLAVARRAGAAWAPTDRLAWLVRGTIMAVTIVTLAKLAIDIRMLAAFAGSGFTDADLGVGLAPGPGTLVMAIAWLAGFVAWGAWLRQVVANIPALGGGFTAAGPGVAFLSAVVPGANLVWGTAVLRDVIVRLSPREAAGLGLVTAWWFAVVAALLPWVGRLPAEPTVVRDLLRPVTGALGGLTDGAVRAGAPDQLSAALGGILLVVAAALAIWLVDRVEDLQEVRRIQLRVGIDA